MIAANKIDAIYAGDEDPVEKLRQEFEPQASVYLRFPRQRKS